MAEHSSVLQPSSQQLKRFAVEVLVHSSDLWAVGLGCMKGCPGSRDHPQQNQKFWREVGLRRRALNGPSASHQRLLVSLIEPESALPLNARVGLFWIFTPALQLILSRISILGQIPFFPQQRAHQLKYKCHRDGDSFLEPRNEALPCRLLLFAEFLENIRSKNLIPPLDNSPV